MYNFGRALGRLLLAEATTLRQASDVEMMMEEVEVDLELGLGSAFAAASSPPDHWKLRDSENDDDGSGSENEFTNSCRICYRKTDEKVTCGCKGGLGFAHRKCLMRWSRIMGSARCELCRKMHRNIRLEKRIWPLCAGGSGGGNIAAFHRSFALTLSDIDNSAAAYSIRDDGPRIDHGLLYTINLGIITAAISFTALYLLGFGLLAVILCLLGYEVVFILICALLISRAHLWILQDRRSSRRRAVGSTRASDGLGFSDTTHEQ